MSTRMERKIASRETESVRKAKGYLSYCQIGGASVFNTIQKPKIPALMRKKVMVPLFAVLTSAMRSPSVGCVFSCVTTSVILCYPLLLYAILTPPGLKAPGFSHGDEKPAARRQRTTQPMNTQ